MRQATLLACAVLAASGAQAAAADKRDAAAAARGKVTYVRYCVSCHGAEGRGDGPLARDLAVPVPDLTTAFKSDTFPLERVKQVITFGEQRRGHGSADMPAWGDAFKKTAGIAAPTVDAAIHNLAHYIWSLQRPAAR
jgi:mono/diheme cytochrome c family protein